MKNDLTQADLLAILSYDPATGIFTWRIDRSALGDNGNNPKAGDVAGSLSKRHGYREIGINGSLYRANRLAWLYMTGAWPVNDVDHENLDKGDDSWSNLRLGTRAQNLANRKPYGKSGVKGVRVRKGRFIAQITVDRKQIYLGSFDEIEAAAAAYEAAAKLHYGQFARTA
jgi:hypothetical protein